MLSWHKRVGRFQWSTSLICSIFKATHSKRMLQAAYTMVFYYSIDILLQTLKIPQQLDATIQEPVINMKVTLS